jgi:superfamily II RNA helicase
LTNNIKIVNNKQKKRLQKEISEIRDQNKTVKKDIEYLIEYESILDEKKKNGGFKMNAVNYIQNNIDNIIHILNTNGFLEYGYGLTSKGIVAMHIQELHPLVLGDLYEKYNGFTDFSAKELTGVLSCFTNISIPQDMRLSIPGDTHINSKIKNCCKDIGILIEKYYDLEVEYQVDTGAEYDIHYELIDYIIKWCECDNENKCITLINELKTTKAIFLGEFIKAILKINNIAIELEKICELNENISLLQKVKEISELTLKYVVTNQSLYI